MRVLITGAGGMLGGDATRAAARAGHEVVALARAQLDIADESAVRAAIEQHAPAAVLNCAAWTDVDGAESDEPGALAVNADGAGNVARAAAEAGVPIVHVSTDYVFDGRGERPYVESDPVAPASAYGRTKLAGEREVLAASSRHAVVRSSWLFGVDGANFVATMLRLGAERDEVAVVTDQVGCPTWTGHLAPALVGLLEREVGGLAHLAASGSCSWHDFAVEIFRQAEVECRVAPATSADMARPAPRPAYSVLGSERDDVGPMPDWRDGLAGYLAARAGHARDLARDHEGART